MRAVEAREGWAAYERLQLTGPLSYATLFDYLYCLLASTVLVKQPLLGGALYMTAQVATMASRLMQPDKMRSLPRSYRVRGRLLTILAAIVAFTLILIYPRSVEEPNLWLLFGVVALVKVRSFLARRLHLYAFRRTHGRLRLVVRLVETALLCLIPLAALLFLSLPGDTAWYLLGGYAIVAILEGYALYLAAADAVPPPEAKPEGETEQLARTKIYRNFRLLSTVTLTALQVTMFLAYTLIGTTAGDLLLCMGIALVFTWIPGRLTRAALSRPFSRRRDPANLLLLGLALWLTGLMVLGLHIRDQRAIWRLMALAACTTAATVAMAALQALSGNMRPVIAFATGQAPDSGQESLQALLANYATMAGQIIALIGLSLMLFFSGEDGGFSPIQVRPALLTPALVLVILALLAALRYPLESQHMTKLERFLQLKENGETNLPLQRQLENVIIRAARRHYGIKLLMVVLRPLFFSRVAGREHVKLDRDTACIFTCNHGELYGPIVASLYVPYHFRPWVISEMAELPEIANYIYTYTIKRQRWLPEKWKEPISRGMAPILHWIMQSIECIPVYRNKPRELIKTLRLSAAAMEAGDNLLIFPENPNDPSLDRAGYLREHIGPFFTGFVTVAQLYEKRTGKCAQFYPIYADKKKHVLTFGPPTRYDASRHPAEEQERIAAYLRGEMQRMAGLVEQGS